MNLITISAVAFAIAFVIGIILYKIFIPLLRKVKLGQKILEIGPSWHKSKEGTPNLGGLIFIVSSLVAFAVAIAFLTIAELEADFTSFIYSVIGIFGLALLQGLIGFVDDYVKLFKKRNKGLSATQKLVLQFVSVAGYLFYNARLCGADTAIDLPWGGVLELGIFYYVVMLLVITYIINCANLTDGIDGLAGSVALIIGVTFLLFGINYEDTAITLTCAPLLGALLAFLVFNFHPAKIFMGDTGSLFLGGFAVGLVMTTGSEFVLIPVSVIWIIEGLSVVLQVASFKLTGKRIFKMSPIHHHFEKCDWSEVKIVAVFSAVTVVSCVLAYYLLII